MSEQETYEVTLKSQDVIPVLATYASAGEAWLVFHDEFDSLVAAFNPSEVLCVQLKPKK